MRRQAVVLLMVTGLMAGVISIPRGRVWAASEAATLKSVMLSASPTGTELALRVDGTYTYKIVQAGPDTLFIDLAGARAVGVARSQQWVNPAFSGYRLLLYQDASGQPVVRVQVDTRQANPFIVQKDGLSLRLLFGKGQSAGAAPAPAPVASVLGPLPDRIPPASSSGPLLVSKVALDKHESGETFVDVSTSRSASFRVMMFPSPTRLVVDIDGARNTSPQMSYPADTAVLKAVRISQFRETPSIVRVVADLNGNPAYDVHATPAGVRIELRPRGAPGSAPLAIKAPAPPAKPEESNAVAPSPVAIAQAATSAPKPEVADRKPAVAPPLETETRDAAKPEESNVVAPSPVAIAQAAPPAPKPEVVDRKPAVAPPLETETRDAAKPDLHSTLPALASSPQAVAAPLPPPARVTPQALRADHAVQILTQGKDAAPEAGQGAPPATPSGPAEEAKPVYTGEAISLNLKDVDLKDFFRLIHEISGLNIILDPNVSGSVTLVLDSVPWDQALDIVLKNNRLGKVLEGNVLRIAKVETLTAEQEGQTKLSDARMNAAALVTVFQPVNYAKAADIAALLKAWVGGALSHRGTVLVDARSNTLIISDVQSQIPTILNVVSKMDKKSKQVSIEARVVLATAGFTRLLSSALSGSAHTPQGSTQVGGGTGTGNLVTPTLSYPIVQNITPATVTNFGSIAITNASSRYLINDVISAQEERDQAKTISRPTIVTQNNVQGMVQQGVQIPIQTTINNTISVTYVDATLKLTVTPQVTDDNNIFLIIHVTNASVGTVVNNGNPSINTQEATTQVLIPDGGTVVFGGITVTSRSKTATYIPWVGSIPIIGNLFKTSNVSDQDQELLFFVSPKILTG